MSELLSLQNAQAVAVGDVPRMNIEKFREAVICSVEAGARLSALFGHPAADGQLMLLAVLADDRAGELRVGSTVVGANYDSLTNDCPQAQAFEREIAEQWCVEPKGHPWLKPIRFQPRGMGVSFSSVAQPPSAVSSSFSSDSSSSSQQQRQENSKTQSRAAVPHNAPCCGVADFFQVEGEEIHEVAVGPVHAGVIEP